MDPEGFTDGLLSTNPEEAAKEFSESIDCKRSLNSKLAMYSSTQSAEIAVRGQDPEPNAEFSDTEPLNGELIVVKDHVDTSHLDPYLIHPPLQEAELSKLTGAPLLDKLTQEPIEFESTTEDPELLLLLQGDESDHDVIVPPRQRSPHQTPVNVFENNYVDEDEKPKTQSDSAWHFSFCDDKKVLAVWDNFAAICSH